VEEDIKTELLNIQKLIRSSKKTIFDFYEDLLEFSEGKNLEVHTLYHGISKPKKVENTYQGTIKFNRLYSLKYYILYKEPGLIQLKLFKDNIIYSKESWGFYEDLPVKVFKYEMFQIVENLNYEILKKDLCKSKKSIGKIKVPMKNLSQFTLPFTHLDNKKEYFSNTNKNSYDTIIEPKLYF